MSAAEQWDVPQKPRIVPEAVYSREETAVLIGLKGESAAKSVSEIDETRLPKTLTGPKGGRVVYRGFDILAYLDGCRRINGKAAPPPENAYRLEVVK